jgi:hypothetical protein
MASNNPHTSIYMRGLYDGFRIGNEEGMTPSKHKLILKQQTAVAQKVFEHVSPTSALTTEQISSSIVREAKFRVEMKTLSGVLDSLKDSALVKEGPRGSWTRVVPREPVTLPEPALRTERASAAEELLPGSADGSITPVLVEELREIDAALGKTPAQTFGDMATALRLKGQALIRMADDMDAAALDFEQRIEDAEKRLARFNQLKALLTEA